MECDVSNGDNAVDHESTLTVYCRPITDHFRIFRGRELVTLLRSKTQKVG